MKHMLRRDQGFALPTILIASVIMLMVLLSAITAVSSITGGINSQYYNQLAREAAESGLAHAEMCLRTSDYSPTWTDALPLKPDMNCSGAVIGGASKWVISTANTRTTYSVARPTVGVASSLRIVAVGTVELLRTSDPTSPWRTYSITVTKNSRYNDTPQIASGAGWKDSTDPGYAGHNGYMLAGNGILYGWGDNSEFQLGDASIGTMLNKPVKVVLPTGVTRAKKVFNSGQGASVLCILATHDTLSDQVYCRGDGLGMTGSAWQRIALSVGLTARDAVVNGYGVDGICVLASDNQAYCAGANDRGNLGNALTNGLVVPITAPTRFRLDLANPAPLGSATLPLTVKKIFSKDANTCVVASDDQAYCAGDNSFGQLGQGNLTTNVGSGKSIPGRALIPGNPAVDNISLPYHGAFDGVFYHTVDNYIYMSGHNGQGTAADDATTATTAPCPNAINVNCYPIPRVISGNTYGKIISFGERGENRHGICILDKNPTLNSGLWCLGANTYGQTGFGTCTTAVDIWYGGANLSGQFVSDAKLNIEAEYQMNSVMAITTNGDVYAAGDNTYGKLGTGAALGACNPTFAKVQLPAGVKGVAVANGDEYSAFVLGDNGKVYGMGRNNTGQLGDGTTTNRNTPVEVQIPRQETVY